METKIRLKDLMTLLRNPDRIRIVKGGRDLFVGFMGQMEEEERQKYADEIVKRIKGAPEIRHRKWKEKGLMSPLLPDQTADYSFSDLQMTLYHVIELEA